MLAEKTQKRPRRTEVSAMKENGEENEEMEGGWFLCFFSIFISLLGEEEGELKKTIKRKENFDGLFLCFFSTNDF